MIDAQEAIADLVKRLEEKKQYADNLHDYHAKRPVQTARAKEQAEYFAGASDAYRRAINELLEWKPE